MIRKRLTETLQFIAVTCLVLLSCHIVHAQGRVIDPAYQALSAGNVYVDPQLQGVIDQASLEQASSGGKPDGNPHTRVKIAVLAALPAGYRDRASYAHSLHSSLDLGKNGLVVVIYPSNFGRTNIMPKGSGVTVTTTGLADAENLKLERAAKSQILHSPTLGIATLAQNVAHDVDMHEYKSSAVLWVVFLVVVIVVVALIVVAMRRKKRDFATAREPVEALKANVLSGIEYLDNYADVLPKNNPDSDQVRAYRQAASDKFDQAARILATGTEVSDLNRAQGLLDRAQADIQQARRSLDIATGGTSNIPGDDALRPPPMPDNEAAVHAIPANQRGVSFFSSQPAPLSSLVPVTITVNGESKQVLVTPEEAEEMRQGRMPQVRSFNVNGQSVPWYANQQYDPYRDYWHNQNSGWSGFGGGMVAGLVGAELLEGLFSPHHFGGGYSPYSYSTDNDYYRGYSNGMNNGGYDNGSFGGGNFGDTSSNYDDSAGDFLTDTATDQNTDFGGGDWGGQDSGGSDFGGGDFGGGDFGGGDSGGGGGDF